jgi:molybdenum cofactor cytidylyltransferase
MVRRTVAAVCAAGPAEVIVVVGAEGKAVSAALEGLPVRIVMNERWADGMSTSLHTGLHAVQPETEAALVVLADQPGLTPSLIEALVGRYSQTRARIVVPCYQDKRGNPVLFDRALFDELLAVQGDKGGRYIISQHEPEVERVAVTSVRMLTDVDTPEDYDSFEASSLAPRDAATRQ